MLDEVAVPRLVVAGVSSGSGKTMAALGLTAALARRGRIVQTFKVGPDFVDSAYLAHVSHRPCRNLDAWMLGRDGVLRSLERGTMGADVAVIEGAAGIFDGHGLRPQVTASGPARFPGSTAELACIAQAPVILVLDIARTGETAAALALGVRQLDPNLRLAGVLFNNVPSDYHARLVEDAVWGLATLPVLGALPHLSAAVIPEQAHGLLPVTENPQADAAIAELADMVERYCDLDLVERIMRAAETLPVPPRRSAAPRPADPVRLGVAFDDAFCFYYPENLELFEDAGAEIVPVSPLEDRALPRDLDGLYIGGGFSDVFAGRLSANRSFAESVARAHAQGLPVYAECGGVLYLSRTLRVAGGAVHQMAGVLPIDVATENGTPQAGYRDVRLMQDCALGPAGTRLRGHEFHFCRVVSGSECLAPAYSVHDSGGEPLGCYGWLSRDLVVSPVQLHFGQNPDIAPRLVRRMREARRLRHAESASLV